MQLPSPNCARGHEFPIKGRYKNGKRERGVEKGCVKERAQRRKLMLR